MNDEIRRTVLAHRRAASVERALLLTRSEDSSLDLDLDAFGRWVMGPGLRRVITQLAPTITGEDAPPLR